MPRPRSALQALKCPISPSCTADGARGCACPVCRKLCRQVMHRLACRICAHQSNLALSSIMFWWWMAGRRLPGILSSPRKHWIEQAALPAHSLTASRIVSTSAPHPSPSHTTPCHVLSLQLCIIVPLLTVAEFSAYRHVHRRSEHPITAPPLHLTDPSQFAFIDIPVGWISWPTSEDFLTERDFVSVGIRAETISQRGPRVCQTGLRMVTPAEESEPRKLRRKKRNGREGKLRAA